MSDLLIRGVADAAIAEIERRAAADGISRAEFLRRHLDADFTPAATVTPADWQRFREATTDLADPDLMAKAWE